MKKKAQQEEENQELNIILTSELVKTRCCYFQLSDYFNMISFKKNTRMNDDESLENEIRTRFISCLLLFDKVIMHSSDPARSTVVYNILKDYKLLIKEGAIVFLFSSEIKNINNDFEKYLENRRKEYSIDKYKNEKDEVSFQLLGSAHMQDVKNLFSNTKILLKKSKSGKDIFKRLLIEDLNPKVEQIVIPKDIHFRTSQIRSLSLTIYQLLTLKKDNIYIFDKKSVDKLCTCLFDMLENQTNRFSRQTIIHQLREELKQSTGEEQKKNDNNERNVIIDAIDTRISFLYAKMNTEDSQIVLYDYHPAFEKRSTYSFKNFELYFNKALGKEFKDIIWSQERIKRFRNNKNYPDFVKTFLSSMAELVNKKNYAMQNEMSGVVLKIEEYENILKMYNFDDKHKSLKNILEAVQ